VRLGGEFGQWAWMLVFIVLVFWATVVVWGVGDRNVWRGVGGRGARSGLVLEEGSVLMVIIIGYCGIWVD